MPRPDLFKAPIVVLDTETTGFAKHEWARVIELAAVVLDERGHEQEAKSWLVRPDVFDGRAAGAVAVHGITREMVEAEGLPTAEVVEQFGALVSWWFDPGKAWTTAFNTAFDRPMIARMGQLQPVPLRWAPCIMERAMGAMGPAGALPMMRGGKWKWPKLSEAAEFFDITFEGDAHRALTDTRVAAQVLVALRLHELGARPITDNTDMKEAS